ncbi:kinase-like protein [Fistulina hepatica ATCC 64428]|uniref:non-specific serine/threonine protein kinase n=1 Tax=Fistulina hepatica ATCC 64428 TaxID=1128425 RepID=A0A0D7AIR9_9AGAR|nr:kinase-like protein [Fistulina hepatica ATCC 64428]
MEADEGEEEQDGFTDLIAGTDEEVSLSLRPQEDQKEILQEIQDLEALVPQLTANYRIVDRLGSGTFSSVYKAVDLNYDKYYNAPWHGNHPAASSAYYQSVTHPPRTKVFVAVKRIYVTSSAERIRNEIAIMEECRGCRHISQLITAFRQADQVVVLMPYHRNEDFRDLYHTLPIAAVKMYFRCLFRALRDIHARGIIHRDVKPANFLFDPRTGIGTLCDFGLASRMTELFAHGTCLHTGATSKKPNGEIKNYERDWLNAKQRDARTRSVGAPDKVGYPQNDTRPHAKANRAGTRGFRAPEVLLKCGQQTGAIDIWAAGMILLFFLTQKFPLMNSSDDVEALVEIATIIGRRKMEKAAALHNRLFVSNVPSITLDGMSWTEFVKKQNENLYEPPDPDIRYYPYYTPEIDHALSLVEALLEPRSVMRLTAAEALRHPFLREPSAPGSSKPFVDDDEFFPHPPGQGKCGKYHSRDTVTEEWYAKVWVEGAHGGGRWVMKNVSAGECLAIGNMPCQLHRNVKL